MGIRTLLSGLLALALVASACGGSDDTTVSTQAASDGPQSFDDLDYSSSPLAQFLGVDFTGGEEDQAQFAEMQQRAEEVVAICMRDKGFEYTPRTPPDISSFGRGGGELAYYSPEWIDKYGFGITTQQFPQSSVGDLVGYPDERFDQIDEYEDPNQEYMQSLSETEREAFQEAMSGPPQTFDDLDDPEEFIFEGPGGCQGEAFEQVYSDGPGGFDIGFFQEFSNDLDEIDERARSDARNLTREREIADCVADEGEVYTDREGLQERFQSRLSELRPRAFGPGDQDPFEASGIDPEEMSERDLNEFFRELERLDPENIPKLAALQEEELALAKIVIGCGGGELNDEIFLQSIRAEYEQEFLDNNADALAEYQE